jgi:uncharacterized protein (UPF0261 family)
MKSAFVIGTFDTKAEELLFVRDLIRAQGVPVIAVDVSTTKHDVPGADVNAAQVAAHHPGGASAVFTGERGSVVAAMADALTAFVRQPSDLGGVVGAGGSGAAALLGPAMRALPIGLPKLLVCTLASGDVRSYVGSSDIAMLYPVVDVSGLNRIARQVLANAAHAMAGMVRAWQAPVADALPALGLTMFGVTTPCVQGVTHALHGQYECLVFHATAPGARASKSSPTTATSLRWSTSPPPRSPTCCAAACSAPAKTGSARRPVARCHTSAPAARSTW